MATNHNIEFAFEEGYKLGREHQRETDRRAGDLNASIQKALEDKPSYDYAADDWSPDPSIVPHGPVSSARTASEAEHFAPREVQFMERPWIEWKGGPCPVDGDAVVEIVTQGGFSFKASFAGGLSWSRAGWASDIVRYRLAEAQQVDDPFKAPEGKAERLFKASIGQPQEMGAAEAEEVKVTEAMYKAGAAAIEEQRKALGEWGRSDSVAAAIIFRAMYAKMQSAAPDPRIAKLERIANLTRSIHDRVDDREFGQFVNHLRSEGWHEQVTSDLVDLRNLFANKPV